MSAISALQQFRTQLIYFLANPNVCYEDIEVDGYCFTVSKRTDALMSNLLDLPPTPYVLLSSLNIRTWGVEEEAFQIFYDLCKLRFKICVVFLPKTTEHEGWTALETEGLCYLYRLSDEVQE